jgi:hypothetical protein
LVQWIEQFLQFDQVQLVDQGLDQLVTRPLLAMDQIFNQLVFVKQLDYLFEAVMHVRAVCFGFSHAYQLFRAKFQDAKLSIGEPHYRKIMTDRLSILRVVPSLPRCQRA